MMDILKGNQSVQLGNMNYCEPISPVLVNTGAVERQR